MATVSKDFKVKNGLIVEGSTATVNNFDVLTKKTDDQNYIIGLIGGTATDAATANTVVKRNGSASFSANVITANLVGDVTGNADTATTLETARNIAGVSFDGSSNIDIAITNLTNVTATAAEVNILDGATLSTQELNTLDGITASTSELNILDGVTASTSEINLLDGATVTTTEINYLSGATSNVQAQLNDKAPLASPALTGTPTAPTKTAGTNSNAIATTAYVDGAVSSLVDSAPDLLNTLNELAAAIGDDANFATTLANSVALKQNTLTAGSNIDITGNTISVTGLDAADISDFNTAALSATSAAYDAAGAAANALSAAEDYADALTTSDIAEGTAQYFTNARAKTSAAELLTGATLTNITITGSGSGLTITAENGVADSNTDNLVEGTSNLYFTNARAVSALQAVTPDFVAVEINNVAKQIAAQATVATASTSTAASWAKADYRSGEFLVKIANGSHTDVSKVILTLDTSDNVAITEYAMVGTNGSLGSVTADVSGTDVRVRVTTANNNSDVMIVGTILK
jgi:hypothetical protein